MTMMPVELTPTNSHWRSKSARRDQIFRPARTVSPKKSVYSPSACTKLTARRSNLMICTVKDRSRRVASNAFSATRVRR